MKITKAREETLRKLAKGLPLRKAMILAEHVAVHGVMSGKYTFQEREDAFARLFLFAYDHRRDDGR